LCEPDRLERKLYDGFGSSLYSDDPFAGQDSDQPGPWDIYSGELSRVERVREAVHRSKRYAAGRLAERFRMIDLWDIWRNLFDVCKEIALYSGGGALLGGAFYQNTDKLLLYWLFAAIGEVGDFHCSLK
jgi:hypothetical protein